MFEIELTICIKIYLALNYLRRLICHKNPTNQPHSDILTQTSIIFLLLQLIKVENIITFSLMLMFVVYSHTLQNCLFKITKIPRTSLPGMTPSTHSVHSNGRLTPFPVGSFFYGRCWLSYTFRGCPPGVMVKALLCRIVVSDFEPQSPHYVKFRTNVPGKDMNPLILPGKG